MKTRQQTYRYSAKQLLKCFDESDWASTIAEHFNTSRAVVQRWRDRDINFDQWAADRYACAIGKHPAEIWADWFDEDEVA